MARHILALNPVVFLRWALPVRLCVPEGRFVRSSLPNFDDGRQPSVGVVARADYADPAKDSGGGTYLAITWERLKIGGWAIAALEDKIVQDATVMVLNAIYEEDFLGLSYGFRPGRGPHDALDALAVGITTRKVNYILDADSRSIFDTDSQDWLVRFVEHRIGDKRIIRLIRKWLKAGIPPRYGRHLVIPAWTPGALVHLVHLSGHLLLVGYILHEHVLAVAVHTQPDCRRRASGSLALTPRVDKPIPQARGRLPLCSFGRK
jgi:hypothetical protein